MKVIDLLNKIANGETPKRIIYDDKQWTYDEKLEDYITYDDSRIDWKYTIMEYINDEVEIIEEDKPKTLNDIRESYGLPRIEDKKIEKLDNTELYLTESQQRIIVNKINEIIDYINKEKE